MYLKGICREPSAGYPQLMRCVEPSNDPESEHHGVGISVNQVFRNVNWIGTPGKRLFLDGDLRPNETLTVARADAVVRDALQTGMFRGIELHDEALEGKRPDQSLEDFVARETLGTDYGLRIARSIFCARVPLTEPMLDQVAEFLNEINREYATGEAEYNWSGYHDNCVHLLHNALAAAGVWGPKSINVIKVRQFFNLAIPANAVVDLGWLASHAPLDDPRELYREPLQREAFLAQGWIPNRHGALLKSMPIHQDNELFDTQTRLFIVNRVFGLGARTKARTLYDDARYTELEANLRFYRARYQTALDDWPERAPNDFAETAFQQRYRAYLEARLEETAELLERLTELRGEP